ncbi:39S ribosomal protein L28, mitochondrial [Galendromus occidentalis]|uniref:Large ribosomal subunit protein bL28m n=1 Tax=Galendromus occidentalis TaxID=34638 RepID=A0AAJ6QPC1_9ACAR|nr:39S ribosomal protein L28, mitochondrial [Galendromus occidentalis]
MATMGTKFRPITERFPKCYQQFLADMRRPRARVMCRPPAEKLRYDASQHLVFKVPDARIPTIFLPESQRGLWGGEEAVKGFRLRKKGRGTVPTLWVPYVTKNVLYSEILDKHFQIETTDHALRLIDESFGFDNYILKTPVQDLNSQMALDIRRKMLLAMARREIYPDNPERRKEILEKYAEFIIPEEEAEWFGLHIREATWKLLEQEQKAKGTPMKAQLRAKFIESLKNPTPPAES